MTEAAPAEQAVEAEKKKRLFHRIPTSLLVTLVGIALTAWLLPAFTRQWDDRQKSHELSASLGAQMAASTARVLEDTRARFYHQAYPIFSGAKRGRHPHRSSLPKAETDWSVAGFRIEAALLASYPRELALRWRGYRELVAGWVQWLDTGSHHWYPGAQPDPELVRQVANIPVQLAASPRPVSAFEMMRRFDDDYQQGENPLQQGARDYILFALGNFRLLETILLTDEADIARDLLGAHVRGYSTTSHDLVHDLIP